jgi:hypothetical protein
VKEVRRREREAMALGGSDDQSTATSIARGEPCASGHTAQNSVFLDGSNGA